MSRRPWLLTLLAVAVVLGACTLTGWQTQWPAAIFGAHKTAVIKPATSSRPTAPSAAPGGPSEPGGASASFVPSGAVAGPQEPGSGVASAGSTPSASASPSADGPASVVDAYFAAINARDYAQAWALGGSNSGASSYAEFAAGFQATRSDSVSILSTSGDVVTAHLVAQQDDGSTKTFTGTYTVTGGVITSFHVEQTG